MVIHDHLRNPSAYAPSPMTVNPSLVVQNADTLPVNPLEVRFPQTTKCDDNFDLVASDLWDLSPFHHSYLIGKILGETSPIKFIMASALLIGMLLEM